MIFHPLLLAVATPPHAYSLGASEIFLLFFIMIGPVKILGPFFAGTRELQPAALRSIAFKVFGLALITVLAVGLLGSGMMRKWHITVPVMQLGGGLIFLLVALQMVLVQYRAPDPSATPAGGVMHFLFPVTITPYGIAALITLMAVSFDGTRSTVVLGLALAVLVLDLLAMLAVRPLMRWIGAVPLQIFGAVLGVLQVALAVQMISGAIGSMHFFATS